MIAAGPSIETSTIRTPSSSPFVIVTSWSEIWVRETTGLAIAGSPRNRQGRVGRARPAERRRSRCPGRTRSCRLGATRTSPGAAPRHQPRPCPANPSWSESWMRALFRPPPVRVHARRARRGRATNAEPIPQRRCSRSATVHTPARKARGATTPTIPTACSETPAGRRSKGASWWTKCCCTTKPLSTRARRDREDDPGVRHRFVPDLWITRRDERVRAEGHERQGRHADRRPGVRLPPRIVPAGTGRMKAREGADQPPSRRAAASGVGARSRSVRR